MRHVFAVIRIAAAISSLWRHRHPISVGITTAAMQPISVAVATAATVTHTALVTPAWPTVALQQQAHDGSTLGHAKPYSPFISWSNSLMFGYNTVHGHTRRLTSAFLICVLMSKWQPFKVGNRRNFPYFSTWNREYGRQGIHKNLHGCEDRYVPAYQIWLWSVNRGRL